jgi:peptidoglycan/LPS O-acetylase OafA/YrhL
MRIRELDGLRGIAVLAIMATHYLSWLPALGAQNGWLGVDLFFVLSGFLITGILLQTRLREDYFTTFYGRWVQRILPPYLLAIVIYLTVLVLAGVPGTLGLRMQYIFYYTNFQVGQPPQLDYAVIFPVKLGLVVLWSLSVGELYYTVWAPVVRYTSHKVLVGILVAMVVAAPLPRCALHTPSYPESYTFYCRMDALAFGSIVAMLMRVRSSNPLAWQRWDTHFTVATVVVTLAAVLLWIYLRGDRSSLVLSTLGLTLADAPFALIAFAVLRHAGSPRGWLRALRASWLGSIGMVSYSLYLFHYPLGYLAGQWVATWGLSRHQAAITQVLLSILVSLAVAYGLWLSMESRILNWKNRHVPSPAHP